MSKNAQTSKVKSIHRSLRMQPEVEEYLNGFDGGSFSQNFEKAVFFFKDSESDMKKRIRQMEAAIKQKQAYLSELSQKTAELRTFISSVARLDEDITQINQSISKLVDKSSRDI